MLTRDPTLDRIIKQKSLLHDALTTSVNNRSTINDEDRLDSIASSFPPFPPETIDVMETDIETNNDVTSVLLDSLPPSEGCDARPPETEKPKVKKRKKIENEKDKMPPALNDGGETSGGSGLCPGKPLPSGPVGGGSGIDFESLMDTNKYDRTSRGPFDVVIQTSEGSTSSIDPIAVGRLLYSISKKEIVEIKKTGFSRINIQLKSRDAANSLISNPVFRAKKYNAYIPLFRTTRRGIIRNVPLDLLDDDVRRGIDSSVIVTSVRRLNRRKRGAEAPSLPGEVQELGLVPSKTISILFKGQTLPEYIFLYMVRHPVDPFVSKTSMCYMCLRFGHLKSQCKGRPRCQHCGEGAHGEAILCPRKDESPFCKGMHRTTSVSCPEYVIQRKIRELAARENISLADARGRLKGNVSTIPNPVYNFSEFPSLSDTPPSTPFPYPSPSPSPLLPSSSVPPPPYPETYSQALSSNISSNRKKLLISASSHVSSPALSPFPSHPPHKPTKGSFPLLPPRPRPAPRASSNFSAKPLPDHNSLLISPNGRLPSSSSEGVMNRHPSPSSVSPLISYKYQP